MFLRNFIYTTCNILLLLVLGEKYQFDWWRIWSKMIWEFRYERGKSQINPQWKKKEWRNWEIKSRKGPIDENLDGNRWKKNLCFFKHEFQFVKISAETFRSDFFHSKKYWNLFLSFNEEDLRLNIFKDCLISICSSQLLEVHHAKMGDHTMIFYSEF